MIITILITRYFILKLYVYIFSFAFSGTASYGKKPRRHLEDIHEGVCHYVDAYFEHFSVKTEFSGCCAALGSFPVVLHFNLSVFLPAVLFS